jgi:hypothetical protein
MISFTPRLPYVGEQKSLHICKVGVKPWIIRLVAWSLYQLRFPGSRHGWDKNINTDLKYDGKVWTGFVWFRLYYILIHLSWPKLYRTHQRQICMDEILTNLVTGSFPRRNMPYRVNLHDQSVQWWLSSACIWRWQLTVVLWTSMCISWCSWFNPLPVQFKSVLPGQKGCVFFSGHLNLCTYQSVLVRLCQRAAFKSSTL